MVSPGRLLGANAPAGFAGGSARSASSATGPRLMVIENDPAARRRMASALARAWPGAPLLTCPADDRAASRARHWHPDVVVADWDEHVDNAVELSRALCCCPELSATPVATLAVEEGHSTDVEVVVLHKPAGARALCRSVELLLDAASLAQART